MKRLVFWTVLLVVLIGVVMAGIAVFVPPEKVKAEIVRQVRNKTGWNLRIDGAVDIDVWPNINLSARDVGLSGRAWADGLEFVSADRVAFGLSVFPLLAGSVEVSGIMFENPIFELEINKRGGTSWDPVRSVESDTPPTSIEDAIGQTSSGSGETTAESTAPASEGADAGATGRAALPIKNLKISSFEIVNGTLSYLDRRSGEAQTLEQVNLTASVPSLDSRSQVDGSLVWRGQPVTVTASIEQLRALLQNTVSDISVALQSEKASLSVEGRVSAEGETLFNGKIAASIPSLPEMLFWATGSSDGIAELGPVALATPLLVTRERIAADALALAIGEAKGSGSVDVQLTGARPKLTSRFAVDRLDLDAFVKSDAGDAIDHLPDRGGVRVIPAAYDGAGFSKPGFTVLAQAVLPVPNPRRSPDEAAAPAASTAPAAPTATAVPSTGAPAGGDALDFAPLQAFDADLDLSIGEIVASGVSARDIALTATLDAGRLLARLGDAEIFGGNAGGQIALDSVAARPSLVGAINARNINLASLAKLGGHTNQVDGALSVDTNFQTAGGSVAEMVGALDAQGEVQVRDGLVGGLPLAEPLNDPAAARIDNLNATIRFAGRVAPIVADGSATWRGESFRLKANLTPGPLALGRSAPVSASVESSRVSAGYDGTLAPSGAADGSISVATPSLRALLVWLNQAAPDMGGLGPFSFKGRLAAAPGSISFKDAKIRLDDSAASGSGRIDTGGPVPSLQANLAFDTLNLTPYMAPADGGGFTPANPASQTGGQTSPQPAGAPAAPSQAAAGPVAPGQWSQAAIDFSGLRSVNAKLNLSAKEILAEKIRVGPAEIAVSLQDGILTSTLSRLGLYQGSGQAEFVLNGAGGTPSLTAKAGLTGINAYPLLGDAADFKYLEGTGDLSFDISASGASQSAMINSLTGVSGFVFRDGAIRGINIPKLVRGVSTDILSGWQESTVEKTDFSSLSATSTITNGVAVTQDLAMIGPLVEVTGAGTTSMPPRTLSWRVEPKVVGTLLGQGRSDEFAGFGVPILIEGSWDNPKIYPDIAGILQNPGAAYEQLRALGGGFFEQIDPLNGASAEATQEKLKQRLEKQTGINVDNIVKDGKIDKEKAVDEAVKGILSIFGDKN